MYCASGCQILMKLEFSRQILKKYPNFKFHKNPSNGSRVFPCGRTDRRTDMTKPIVAFRNFANAPKKHTNILHGLNLQILSVKTRGTQSKHYVLKGFIGHGISEDHLYISCFARPCYFLCLRMNWELFSLNTTFATVHLPRHSALDAVWLSVLTSLACTAFGSRGQPTVVWSITSLM